MKYKGFLLPYDIGLMLVVFLGLIKYSWLASRTPMPLLLQRISNSGTESKLNATTTELIELDKRWRSATFFLRRLFRTDRPCLPRTLVLYEWCCIRGLEAKAVIGVHKDKGALTGHSWLLLADQPYHEDMEFIKNYTIMLEG